MGRRRRKVLRTVKKTLPKVFGCPRCGMISVRVTILGEDKAKVACGTCALTYPFDLDRKKEPIDIYNAFVDRFMSGEIGA